MRRHLCAWFVIGVLTVGCQSIGPTPTDSMQVKTMKVNGVELTYVEEGSGPTVLFVHGALGDWRSSDSLRPHISPKYRYVSISRRYHYPNVWNDDGRNYTFDQHVEDAAAFIRAMNVGKVHLVGSSYSGRLVSVLALKYPELLRSVVIGEPPSLAWSPEGKAATAAIGKEFAAAAAAAKSGDDTRAAILIANAVLNDPNGFGKLPAVRQQRWLENAKTMGPSFRGPPPSPFTCEHLKDLKVPALAVRGQLTGENYRLGHDALLSCLPVGEGAIIPGANHFWGPSNPPAAATAILAFISKH